MHILSARRNKNRRYKEKDTQTALLVRLIRAEAEGDGELGMLMVSTVSVNRVRADCLDFGDIRTVSASKGAVKRQQKAMDQRARD